MSTSQTLVDKRKLRLKRVGAGLTQPALAELAQIHPSFISLLERGLRGGSPVTLEVLTKALGCRVADLMPDLTPAELAELAELHPGFIQLLRRGGHGFTPERLSVLADVFGCDITELTPDEPDGAFIHVRADAACAHCGGLWSVTHACRRAEGEAAA